MAKKKAFILRIDEQTLADLEAWAEDEFRSMNGQIEFILHQALVKTGRQKKGKIKEADKKKKPSDDQSEAGDD